MLLFQSNDRRTALFSTLRSASHSSLIADSSFGKCPRFLMILRSCMFCVFRSIVTGHSDLT